MTLVQPEFTRRVQPLEERFWSFVPDRPDDGCWVWYGGNNFSWGRKANRQFMRAHRAAWEFANGRPVPPGKFVVRSCDNDRCVRPDHLTLISSSKRARINPARRFGAAHWRTKLTDEQVMVIRIANGRGVPQKALAERFGVHSSTINNIVKRRRRETVFEWTKRAA